MRLPRRSHVVGTAAVASAASPLLAQAGPHFHADPVWLLLGGIVGPGCTLVLGEVARAGMRASTTFVEAVAEGHTTREAIASAMRAARDEPTRVYLPAPAPTETNDG